jgi:hypothetical protein
MNEGPTKIKHRLRWRSDAFMKYLRNLAVDARSQNQAMDAAASIANFL